MNLDVFANIVGMLGTAAVVGTYFMLQMNMLDAKGLAFNLWNLVGASLLLFSLVVHFNLASFVIELFWIAASLVGLYNYFRARKKQ